jgi:hypothetical protein
VYGEWIFLRIDGAGANPLDGLGQIHSHRHRAQQLESAHLNVAGEHANEHAREIGGPAHPPQTVRDVTEAVLEIAEDPVVEAAFDLPGEDLAEPAVHRDPRGIAGLEEKGQIEEAQFGHTVGEVAGRLIAEGQHAALDSRSP